MPVPLSLAISDYDHVRDLATGKVRPEGIDLTVLDFPVQEIFQRYVPFREWDVSEFSFALYSALRGAGDTSLTALPVFPSRVFRHSAVYVRADGPDSVDGLKGMRIGVPEWAQTAGVWARGILAQDYGLDLASVSWVQGGVNQVGRTERVTLSLPDGIKISQRTDRSLDELLLAGELDAIITAHAPHSFESGQGRVVRLFRDHVSEERRFWGQTGIIPIMHLVVVQTKVLQAQPWVLFSLQKAFDRARCNSIERMRDVAISRFPIPWVPEQLENLERDAPGDWWPYGIEPNRKALERFCRYSYDQGVAARLLTPEDLFAEASDFSARI